VWATAKIGDCRPGQDAAPAAAAAAARASSRNVFARLPAPGPEPLARAWARPRRCGVPVAVMTATSAPEYGARRQVLALLDPAAAAASGGGGSPGGRPPATGVRSFPPPPPPRVAATALFHRTPIQLSETYHTPMNYVAEVRIPRRMDRRRGICWRPRATSSSGRRRRRRRCPPRSGALLPRVPPPSASSLRGASQTPLLPQSPPAPHGAPLTSRPHAGPARRTGLRPTTSSRPRAARCFRLITRTSHSEAK
jgi:hypothetical protein